MCGIAGFVNLQRPDAPDVLDRMLCRLRHRGPDDAGTWSAGATALGHRRLSIIDLAGGHQPMLSRDGRYVVVFNGEIYNYRDIRRHLEPKGYRFDTNSDTEVLLYLYQEYGEAMTAHLRGMFAFALWDTREQRLFAARDRLGKKPFYYWTDGTAFVFSSELTSLAASQAVPLEKDWAAMRLFFRYGNIPPPFSGYSGVRKLPPAAQLTFSDGRVCETVYWRLEPAADSTRPVGDVTAELDSLLAEAVRLRLISDVPLGAFLSGGLDSSLVVAYMRQLCSGPVRTYTVGFEEATFDETRYATAVARHLGVEHHRETVRMDSARLLDTLTYHFGEPFGDSSAIPTYYLSKFTRTGVTVALSGDGGDEIFGGYSRYLGRRYLQFYRRLPRALRRATVGTLMKHTRESTAYFRASFLKMLRALDENATLLDENPDNIAPNVFTGGEIDALFGGPAPANAPPDPVLARLDRFRGLHPIEQMMFLDAETYLEADINVKVDRMSMAHALETRAPFLDHKVAEFMARVPLELKLRRFTTKFLLKKLGEARLPYEIVHRRKHGFGVPLGDWFRKELAPAWQETVTPAALAPLDPAVARQFWETHQRGDRDYGYQLWHLLVFCLWNRQRAG